MMLQALFNLYVFSLSCSVITAVFTYTAVKQNNARKNYSESINGSTNDPRIVGVSLPIVINTWPFIEAGERAWEVLNRGGSALDAVEQGCSKCEELQCDGTVGYGGSPDENGETTLDAMIMDGETHSIGAVGALRRVKNAITVARYIMEHTKHTLLVGSQATDFALMMGFPEHNLTTSKSESLHISWKQDHCQPNFWKNVVPDPKTSCGPYFPASNANFMSEMDEIEVSHVSMNNHDTIGMIAIDSMGRVAAGTSTNGARNKIPGRVGDSPIPGSGAYVDKNVGASAATGDGDVMMRFMPSLIAVEGMRHGLTPDAASTSALQRIIDFYPAFSGAVVALNIQGQFGAACFNLPEGYFNYTVGYPDEGVHLESVPCMNATVVSNLLIFE